MDGRTHLVNSISLIPPEAFSASSQGGARALGLAGSSILPSDEQSANHMPHSAKCHTGEAGTGTAGMLAGLVLDTHKKEMD